LDEGFAAKFGLPEWDVGTVRDFITKLGVSNACMKSDSRPMKEMVKSINDVRSAVYEVIQNEEMYFYIVSWAMGAAESVNYGGLMNSLYGILGGVGEKISGERTDDSNRQMDNKSTNDWIETILLNPQIWEFLKHNEENIKRISLKVFGETESVKKMLSLIQNGNFGEFIKRLNLKGALSNVLADKQTIGKMLSTEFSKTGNQADFIEKVLRNKNVRGYMMTFLKDGNFGSLEKDLMNLKDSKLLKGILLSKFKGEKGGLGKLLGVIEEITGKDRKETSPVAH
jgi:hypothetical protein